MPPEASAKKTAKTTSQKEAEWKKNVAKECDAKSVETPPRAKDQGEGEVLLATPKPPKPKKPKEKAKLPDSVPKKNAQRAKGSTSLNKAIEVVEAEPKSERRRPITPSEKLSKCEGLPKSGLEEPKSPVATPKRKKKTEKAEKADRGEKAEKGEKKPASKAKQSLTKECSKESVEEKPADPQMPAEVKSDEIQTVNSSFNSCSFFEKLQQGVKAYFSSRSSFNPEDRNKKEGGIRTRGSLGKAVKEEVKKSNSGIKKVYNNPEKDSLCDRIRVLGGQSNNFLTTKPKISRNFRKLKRKKLYHPKKSYVRIQIPRKGYFYRSTVELRIPERATPEVLHQRGKTQADSKSNVSESAPPRKKAALHRRNKKAMKKQEPPDEDAQGAPPAEAQPADPFTTEYIQELLSEFKLNFNDSNFEERVKEYVTFNWPKEQMEISFEEAFEGFEKACMGSETEKSPFDACTEKAEDELAGSCMEKAQGELSGACMERVNGELSGACMQKWKGELSGAGSGKAIGEKQPGDSTWEGLLDDMSPALGRNHLVYNLEVVPEGGGGSPAWDVSLQGGEDAAEGRQKAAGARSDSLTKMMDGVDLHVELQNYIKTLENFHTSKGRTKNTLQCNFHDNYIPLNIYSSSREEYFDVTETKSGTSFNSATSDCPQLEEDSDEMFLDVKADSQIAFDEIRKAKSENDPETPQQQDSTLKNSVKRTAGITSFQVFRLNDKTTWGSPFWTAATKNLLAWGSKDDYEKIQPYSSERSTEFKRKIKSSIVFRNSHQSLSAESVPQPVRNVASERLPQDQIQQDPIPPVESALPQHKPSVKVVPPDAQSEPNASVWSPTLQELIEIYNGVLKQNTKIRRSSKNVVTRCFSSHLFSFLSDKLKEKHCKSDLINLSKEFRRNHKPANFGKPLKSGNEFVQLQEYVAIFQEILHSSLSINQITRLNDIISGLQEYSEKNYKLVKDLSKEAKKPLAQSDTELAETNPPIEEEEPTPIIEPLPVPKKTVKTPQKSSKRNKKKPESTEVDTKIKKPQKLKPKPKSKPDSPQEEIVKTKLPSPAELESILKSCFGLEGSTQQEIKEKEEKKKILVTVKLHGNQVLVNGFSYFNNENSLRNEKSRRGTSELIIENVTKKKMPSGIWWRENKSSQLRLGKQPQVLQVKKKKDSKEQKKKMIKKIKKRTPAKRRKQQKVKKPEQSALKNPTENQQFEYNQQQLRAQHPIEAIAESSESKISQHLETSEVDHWKGDTPEIKLPKQEKTLKEGLEEQVFSKDVIRDFGWGEEETRKKFNRVGSCQLIPQGKRLPATKKKQATKVRSMVELKKKTSSRTTRQKTVSLRPRSTYLCYPSEQKSQGKTSKPCKEKKTTASVSSCNKIVKIQKSTEQQKKEECKNASKETTEKCKKSEEITKQKVSDSVQTDTQEILLVKPVAKSTTEISPKESDPVPDSSKLECLYSEKKQEQPDGETTTEAPSTTQFTSAVSIQNNSFVSLESKPKDFSIAFLRPGTCNDCISFLADVIHSDSFLSNFPSHVVSKSRMKSLFKCNSDLKFYPGRLSDGGTADEKPLVTFVLTPSQNEQADLPKKQVKVINKGETNPTLDDENDDDDDDNDDDDDDDDDSGKKETKGTGTGRNEEFDGVKTLKSIEEFIKYLSKCRKEAIRRQNKLKMEEEKRKLEAVTPKYLLKSRAVTASYKSRFTGSSARKPLHEPLKRKMTEPKKGREQQKNDKNQEYKKNVLANTKFLDKMITLSLWSTLYLKNGNLLKESKSEGKTDKEKVKDEEKKEAKTKYNLTGLSVDPTQISPELLTAIKMAISKVEFEDKEEIIAAIGDGLFKSKPKQMENVEVSCDPVSKKQKEVKIKIHCSEKKKQESEKENTSPPEIKNPLQVSPCAEEIDLLDSFVPIETQGGDLKRKNSTYFDAVEKVRGEQMGGDSNRMNQPAAEGVLDLNLEFGVKEEKNQKSQPTLSASEEKLLSKEILGKKSEDAIYSKIEKSLEDGQILYSMELLKVLIKKKDSDSERLKNLLAVIENKSRNIIMNLEKGAWQKVLSLLEEVATALESDKIENATEAQLETNKHFVDRIQLLNIRRLLDLQNFCSCFTKDQQQNKTNSGNVIEKIKHSLKSLKQKLTLKRDTSSRILENVESSEEQSSGLKIHSTVSLPEIRESREGKIEDLQELRRKKHWLQSQQIGEESESGIVPREIEKVRRAVEAKMGSLQRALDGQRGREGAELREADSRNRATSLLRVSRESLLSPNPGYVDMMKSLIKVWDTRLTIGSITGDCFN